jgi:hypothetical protein
METPQFGYKAPGYKKLGYKILTSTDVPYIQDTPWDTVDKRPSPRSRRAVDRSAGLDDWSIRGWASPPTSRPSHSLATLGDAMWRRAEKL